MDAEYYFNRSFHVRETKAIIGEMVDRLDLRLEDPTNEEERKVLALEVMMESVMNDLEREAEHWDNLAGEVIDVSLIVQATDDSNAAFRLSIIGPLGSGFMEEWEVEGCDGIPTVDAIEKIRDKNFNTRINLEIIKPDLSVTRRVIEPGERGYGEVESAQASGEVGDPAPEG